MTTSLRATSPGLHAVVVGAGPSGLAIADVLGRRLDRVTLIERNDIPDHGAPGDIAAPDPPAAAVRRVLRAPRVVVRPGLEVVGLVFGPGRVMGVEVSPRRSGGKGAVAIPADLVVDATGWRHDRSVDLPDGLIVAGRATGDGDPPAAGRATSDGDERVAQRARAATSARRRRAASGAERCAVTLGRCLDDHLARHAGLDGFSALAEQALAAVASPPATTAGSDIAVPAGAP